MLHLLVCYYHGVFILGYWHSHTRNVFNGMSCMSVLLNFFNICILDYQKIYDHDSVTMWCEQNCNGRHYVFSIDGKYDLDYTSGIVLPSRVGLVLSSKDDFLRLKMTLA